ncbi:LiaF transmembrane domain-containing protein [Pedobacter duraquae]|uniref:Cell wall-active antibiotic response 4TMS protein YvqF n=1 Tax=Pedobacter duraquae TaxID=425511 RepID=A0A4R6IQ15_9SPHI|nr:LiaF domain-containing protein [Pedobacter duraquae]TDO24410.1 cell wall-active antibiotic response 4TMS protein YvqF [Pedobacter duraquae]
MENHINTNQNQSKRLVGGVIMLLVGLIFLLRNLGMYIPGWVFSWSTFLMVIGLCIGFKRNFRGAGWLILFGLGSYFTLGKITDLDFGRSAPAVFLIALGLWIIFKPKGPRKFKRNKEGEFEKPNPEFDFGPAEAQNNQAKSSDRFDIVDTVNIFSGSHQHVFSKNFKGGEVVSVFGGCELNLTQADFEGTIILDVVAIFGGVKMLVPSGWQVKSEITALFGGVDDKRKMQTGDAEPAKIVILQGTAVFGGIEIKSF